MKPKYQRRDFSERIANLIHNARMNCGVATYERKQDK